MATILAHAPAIFGKVGLRIGLGPGKTKVILLDGYDKSLCLYPLDNPGVAAPHVVSGFSSCLVVPRRFSNDNVFITEALHDFGVKQDRIMDLAEEISEEDDPFAALRLLHVCGVTRFGHVLNAVPPRMRETSRGKGAKL